MFGKAVKGNCAGLPLRIKMPGLQEKYCRVGDG
jgi:hypothetical protein